MQNLSKFYIDGSWVSPSLNREFSVLNPATEGTVDSIYLADEADVDAAVAAAKKAFESFSQSSKEQ